MNIFLNKVITVENIDNFCIVILRSSSKHFHTPCNYIYVPSIPGHGDDAKIIARYKNKMKKNKTIVLKKIIIPKRSDFYADGLFNCRGYVKHSNRRKIISVSKLLYSKSV